MLSSKRRLSLIAGLVALSLFSAGVGCTGFFVNQPNSIAVTQAGASTFSVAVGAPKQLTATATYNSGTKIVTNSATWSSSTPCATVSTTGLLTAVGPNSNVTITATLAAVQGTITGSTTGGSAQTLTITAPAGTLTTGSTGQFSATLNGLDETSSATWSSSDTSILSFSTTTNGLANFVSSGTATVSASLATGTTCANGSLSVTVQ